MSKVPDLALIAGIAGGALIVIALVLYFLRSRTINLTRSGSPDEKPEWMRSTPQPETVVATQADGEGITVFDYDPGEALAAPFAEQIEDIVRAKLQADSTLSAMQIDLGTGPDGGLEIIVNGKTYTSIDELPDTRLQDIFREAVAKWNGT